jgi:hypothetical protein
MAIWGNRETEPAAEQAPAEAAPAAATPGNDTPSRAAPEGGGPAPEGGGSAADGGAPAAESAPSIGEPAPAPPVSESPAGTDAPAPVLAEDVVVIDAEAAVKDPALTGTRREPAAPDAPGSISPQRWSEILVSFVDNPRDSVKMAADAVDSAIEEVVASVRVRQRALESSWQSSETDTEQLRIALREYRRFGAQVRHMSPEEPAQPGTAAAG